MTRGAFYAGTVGAILGSITGAIGLIWCVYNIRYIMDLDQYLLYLANWSRIVSYLFAYFTAPVHTSLALFNLLSVILIILLIVSGIFTGLGFFGTYRTGGGAMGIVGLISAITGITIGASFIFLGVSTLKINPFLFSSLDVSFMFVSVLFGPTFFDVWRGLIVLAITFIVLGVSSIAVRNSTMNSSASLAAGILSIIGACFFFPYGLVLLVDVIMIEILGCIFAFISFALILVAFILWAVVFFSSRNM